MKTVLTFSVIAALMAPSFPAVSAFAAEQTFIEHHFDEPIDAFSVGVSEPRDLSYSYLHQDGWSEWLELETEFDEYPDVPESSLAMLPYGVSALRVKGIESDTDIHPIRVSKEPVRFQVAAVNTPIRKSIVTRSEWGADESYLYQAPSDVKQTSTQDKGDNGTSSGTPSGRISDCAQAQSKYPAEFRTQSTVTKDARGQTYRWALQYSPQVKLLAVHHSALLVQGDPRPPVERIRALYKYHAANRGWGDIGYHYAIDEDGRIYEGRQGGKYVVGGHAYCHNIGSVGVVLLGNFEIEQPSQKQIQSLQHLLSDLSKEYDIDLRKSVQFHGKTLASPVVRHRDLSPTLCPGHHMSDVFGQVIRNVQTGMLDASVRFTTMTKPVPKPEETEPPSTVPGVAPGISFTGRTTLAINPGGKQRLSFAYTAGVAGAYEGKKVADIRLSSTDIKLYLDNGRGWIPVTTGILLPSDLPAGESTSLQMIVEAPMEAGNYTFDIGGIRLTLAVAGRRIRTGDFINPFDGGLQMVIVRPPAKKVTPVLGRIRPHTRRSIQSDTAPLPAPASPSIQTKTRESSSVSPSIRIRLSADASPSIAFSDNGTVGGVTARAGSTFDLLSRGNECEVRSKGERVLSAPIVRFSSSVSGILTASVIRGKKRSYRGVIECRVVNGTLALINELPLEDYMAGLAEEPDSEPYEKQRAFAIAARTYAAYYMDPANRKFPGMPYDGSDDPAVFQSYTGVDFTAANPNWLRAAMSTQGSVLMFGGKLIRPPYFSSNDGRTRSPAEIGWKNFPFAEIFASKPDPWCNGMTLRGHGVGMSGCGAKGQANEGKSAEQILRYYYPGALLGSL